MNSKFSDIMKRATGSLCVGICLFLVSAVDASAHEIEYRPPIVHDHYGYARTMSFPGWLRRNRDFQHWYMRSRYRFMRRMTWNDVYERYRFEQRYRWNNRRYHTNVYHDDGYRTHKKWWKRRKY